MGRDFCQAFHVFSNASEEAKNIDLMSNNLSLKEEMTSTQSPVKPYKKTSRVYNKRNLFSDLAGEIEQQKKIKRESLRNSVLEKGDGSEKKEIVLENDEEDQEDEGSDGCDSEPSFDNFDNEQLAKLLPTHAKKKSNYNFFYSYNLINI